MSKKGYIWNKDWVWPYESLYGMLSKFAYINVLQNGFIFDLIKVDGCKKTTTMYYYNKYMTISKYRIDFIKVNELLERNIAGEIYSNVKELLYPLDIRSFPYSFEYPKEQWFDRDFRYCPECIRVGYHSLYHQLAFAENCGIHRNVKLQTTCPNCKDKMSFVIQSKIGKSPFSCCNCGYKLYDKGFLESMDLWNEPIIQIGPKRCQINAKKHTFSLLLPHEKGSRQWNLLNAGSKEFLERLCIKKDFGAAPDYKFSFRSNGRDVRRSECSISRLYFKGMLMAKRRIRTQYKIHPNKMAKHAECKGYKISEVGVYAVAYLVWVKMNLGITILEFIDDPKEIYLNMHANSSMVSGQNCYNDLASLITLDKEYPDDWKEIVYSNVIYRVILVKLLRSYQLYLADILERYEEIKDMLLVDFFLKYWEVLKDNTQYVMSLDDGVGEIWVRNH